MSNAQRQVDRRRWPRFAVPESEVYVANYIIPRYLRKPKGKPVSLVNISGGGLQFVSRQHMKPEERLCILVKVPAFISYLMFRGRVVWSQVVSGKQAYRIGVRFTAIERETRNKLDVLRKDFFFRKRKTEEEKKRIIDMPSS
ncbi:MAG: PilZ domain-containing protein [Planctomycetota bacterium]